MNIKSEDNLGKKVARSSVWVYGRMLVTNLLNLGVIAILARQLTPAEFGLVALAQVILRFLTALSSEGVNQYVIYDNSPERLEKATASFWLDLSISSISSGVGFLLLPLIAGIYHEEMLIPVLSFILLRYPINSLAKVPDALMRKNFDFKKLEIRDTILEIIVGVLSITMAMLGYGVWSLVVPGVISSVLRAIIVFQVSKWRPQFTLHFKYWKSIFKYSSNVTGGTLTSLFISEGDTLVIGKVMGTQMLGIYNLAWQASNIATRTIVNLSNRLTLPALSSVSHNNKMVMKTLNKIQRILSIATFPLLIGLLVLANEFVLTLYGDQWVEAVLPLQIMIIYAMRYTVGSPIGSVFKALGRPDLNFKLGLVIMPFYLGAIWCGSLYGIVGVAIGVTVIRTIFGFLSFELAARLMKTTILEILKPLAPAFYASLIMGAVILGLKAILLTYTELRVFINLIILSFCGIGVYWILLRTRFNALAIDLCSVSGKIVGERNSFIKRALNVN